MLHKAWPAGDKQPATNLCPFRARPKLNCGGFPRQVDCVHWTCWSTEMPLLWTGVANLWSFQSHKKDSGNCVFLFFHLFLFFENLSVERSSWMNICRTHAPQNSAQNHGFVMIFFQMRRFAWAAACRDCGHTLESGFFGWLRGTLGANVLRQPPNPLPHFEYSTQGESEISQEVEPWQNHSIPLHPMKICKVRVVPQNLHWTWVFPPCSLSGMTRKTWYHPGFCHPFAAQNCTQLATLTKSLVISGYWLTPQPPTGYVVVPRSLLSHSRILPSSRLCLWSSWKQWNLFYFWPCWVLEEKWTFVCHAFASFALVDIFCSEGSGLGCSGPKPSGKKMALQPECKSAWETDVLSTLGTRKPWGKEQVGRLLLWYRLDAVGKRNQEASDNLCCQKSGGRTSWSKSHIYGDNTNCPTRQVFLSFCGSTTSVMRLALGERENATRFQNSRDQLVSLLSAFSFNAQNCQNHKALTHLSRKKSRTHNTRKGTFFSSLLVSQFVVSGAWTSRITR